MKKQLVFRLTKLFLTVIIISIAATLVVEFFSLRSTANKHAQEVLTEIETVVSKNILESELTINELNSGYFAKADAIALIYESILDEDKTIEEFKSIADALQVDEINLFNENGVLFSGTNEEYFGSSFNSGEQMQFFKPMLEDRSLRLIQEVMPNTVSGKDMLYLAVWSDKADTIIQIGIDPTRIIEATKLTSNESLFTLLTTSAGEQIFIVDNDTQDVLLSTNPDILGKSIYDIGFDIDMQNLPTSDFFKTIDGSLSLCQIREINSEIFVYASDISIVFGAIPQNVLTVAVFIAVASVFAVFLILKIFDDLIIKNVNKLIEEMKNITAGKYDHKIEINSLPEFEELSKHANLMVENLVMMAGKMSTIFDYADMPMAMYQCGMENSRVVVTNKFSSLLKISDAEAEELLSDNFVFLEKISTICSNAFDADKDIYMYETAAGDTVYLKVKAYFEDSGTWGIIQDVTEEMEERKNIEHERDMDFLTNIFSRRAFIRSMTKLFRYPQKIKYGALIMMDLDNLKYVNDNFGHEHGDKYICKAAETLSGCSAPNKITTRLSGDEFAIFIYGNSSEEETQGYVDSLYNDFRNAKIDTPEGEFTVGISGGYLFYPDHSTSFKEMMGLADETMYMVKHSTKGAFLKYNRENHVSMDRDEDDFDEEE